MTDASAPRSFPQTFFQPDPGSCQILLVRHGQSAPFVEGEDFPMVDGQGDPPLSPLGEWQAEQVGIRLADEPITALYCSTLQRTAQTAAPLAGRLGLDVTVDANLREVHLGEGEGGKFRKMVADGHPAVLAMREKNDWGQVPGAETILVPISGGGLISGLAAAAKARKPGIKIIGVSMERGAAMHECLKAGKPIHVEEMKTLADSLGGGIGLDNQYTFPMTRDLVDDTITVSEAQIAGAIRHAYWEERQIIEGSGSVSIAAVLAGKAALSGPTVCVVSGANIDLGLHHRIISGEDVDVTKPES